LSTKIGRVPKAADSLQAGITSPYHHQL